MELWSYGMRWRLKISVMLDWIWHLLYRYFQASLEELARFSVKSPVFDILVPRHRATPAAGQDKGFDLAWFLANIIPEVFLVVGKKEGNEKKPTIVSGTSKPAGKVRRAFGVFGRHHFAWGNDPTLLIWQPIKRKRNILNALVRNSSISRVWLLHRCVESMVLLLQGEGSIVYDAIKQRQIEKAKSAKDYRLVCFDTVANKARFYFVPQCASSHAVDTQ